MKIGDVVALPSGSPRLTVVKTDEILTTVVWINYTTHEPHTLELPTKALVIAPEQKKFDPSSPPWKKEAC